MGKVIEEGREKMLNSQYIRGQKVLENLKNGAPACQIKELPAVFCENDESTYENGAILTDTIAEWGVKKFTAGPFDRPPLKQFRVNPLKAIVTDGKVRPVINVSAPRGASFNDNIRESKMEKVEMSSAKRFGQSVRKAGKGAIMSKFDMANAYKNVPCKTEDLRLQGFCWGKKFFVETTQMFGAKTSVANYDMLGKTMVDLALAKSEIPSCLVHRQLDDVPVVAPKNSGWCEEFSKNYEETCKSVNIELAPECEKHEKAFINKTDGKVLGIVFDTEEMTWRLPEEKRKEYMNTIHEALEGGEMSILSLQKLLGKLNFVTSMCPMLRSFKKPLQEQLRMMEEAGQGEMQLTEEVRADLKMWWKFLDENRGGVPIPVLERGMPLTHKTVTTSTDAAGWSDNEKNAVGMGCVVIDEEGKILCVNQTLWKGEKVGGYKDSGGKRLGNKTTTLEFAGIIIPFLLYPELFKGQCVLVQVDNISCHFAWENGYCKEDNTASILVRVLVLMCAKLECEITIVHLPRESTWESRLVDRLSREKTTKGQEKKLLDSFEKRKLPKVFEDWMCDPIEDWGLATKIVNVI